jgi:hypothetical protein
MDEQGQGNAIPRHLLRRHADDAGHFAGDAEMSHTWEFLALIWCTALTMRVIALQIRLDRSEYRHSILKSIVEYPPPWLIEKIAERLDGRVPYPVTSSASPAKSPEQPPGPTE